jgi:predicted metalloprotease with PDZ domain
MKITYNASIEVPENHYLSVRIDGTRLSSDKKLAFYLPSWSPGSYLMREYGRNVRCFRAENSMGEVLHFSQMDKGVWEVDFENSEVKNNSLEFNIYYEVYCHELTVRTSHIDATHAFLHGPSVFMGILDKDLVDPILKVKFPPCWAKITTGLKDISDKREEFIYSAKNYDELIDTPLEIGCHETDGFQVNGVNHHLAYYGPLLPHNHNIKADIKKIVEKISATMKEIPYEEYSFITHFIPGIYGGLEHLNSTALQYSSFNMTDKKGYIGYLELVAHEYFHTWNVKRIRPKELGPFNYLTEALTKMHWLTEGLTSFMDQLFIYRCDFISIDEYLELMVKNLNHYFSTPGRKFHSLEDSSFNSWIKLYRPDENSKNSSISYYLKGGLVFFALNILLFEKGKSINDLLDKLWSSYKANPDIGLEEDEVFQMVEDIAGAEVKDEFVYMIKSTEEIDFENFLTRMGVEVEYEKSDKADLGATIDFTGDRVLVKSVALDAAAYKSGLNANDEILAINGMRVLKSSWQDFSKFIIPEKSYVFTISRLNQIHELDVVIEQEARKIKKLTVKDEIKAKACLQ